ncbi:uncharacterized protein LOC143530628 [Bidens hawaiensis]|uniref:uncharacterized protein LOC143530628 n=1 Tax=Bidens hawaiensis TaxID=980011 RepID=UPI004049F61E
MQKEGDKEETRVKAEDVGAGEGEENRLRHPVISTMEPLTHEDYGGGMYGKDDEKPPPKNPRELLASVAQSADGPSETNKTKAMRKPPPSSGDRDIDITGQSYIQ